MQIRYANDGHSGMELINSIPKMRIAPHSVVWSLRVDGEWLAIAKPLSAVRALARTVRRAIRNGSYVELDWDERIPWSDDWSCEASNRRLKGCLRIEGGALVLHSPRECSAAFAALATSQVVTRRDLMGAHPCSLDPE